MERQGLHDFTTRRKGKISLISESEHKLNTNSGIKRRGTKTTHSLDVSGIPLETAHHVQSLLDQRPHLFEPILASVAELKKQTASSKYLATDQLLASLAENKETQPVTLAEFLGQDNIFGLQSGHEIDEAILSIRARRFDTAVNELFHQLLYVSKPQEFDKQFLITARIK